MFLRMLYDDDLSQMSYLVGCEATGEAVVIDPLRDVDRYIDLAAQNQLTIVAAAETHIHADFVSGARQLAELADAKVFVSAEGGTEWQSRWLNHKPAGGAYHHQLLHDGEHFTIGRIRFHAIHTPGHTPEHLCFLVVDAGGGATDPIGVCTGDFVFVSDLGRPDLLENALGIENAARQGLEQLKRSAQWFKLLPQFTQVWPAHGSGSPCGKELGAIPQSTVGYELRYNQPLRHSHDDALFEHDILAGQPEPPPYFARMKQINRDGPDLLAGLPKPKLIPPSELAADGSQLIDVRPWDTFIKGHLQNALSFPLHRTFTTTAGSYLDPQKPIHVVTTDERELNEAVRRLVRVGLDQITAYALGSQLPAQNLVSTAEISIHDFLNHAPEATVLDVRRANEFVLAHVPGATNITHIQLAQRLHELPQGRPLYTMCRTGKRSARAVSLLQIHGIHAINVAGGFDAYKTAGGQVAKL